MTRYAFVQMLDRTHRLYTAKASDKKIKEVKYDPCYSEYHLYLIANGYIGLKTKEELCDTTLCHFGEYGTVCVLPTIMMNK